MQNETPAQVNKADEKDEPRKENPSDHPLDKKSDQGMKDAPKEPPGKPGDAASAGSQVAGALPKTETGPATVETGSKGETAVDGKKRPPQPDKRRSDFSTMRRVRAESREMLQAYASINQAQIENYNVFFNQPAQRGVQYRGDLGVSPLTPRQVAQEDTARIRRTYIQHDGYQTAYQALEQNHLVILQAPARTGKWAAAVHMASELADGQLELLDVPADVDLEERFRNENLEAQLAYLVDGILASRAERLKERDWKDLSARMSKAGSYLVVCASNDVHLPIELHNVLYFQLAFPAAIGPIELVRRHLDYLLDREGETPPESAIEGCLADEQIADLLTVSIPPANAQQLAEQLVRYLSGKCSMEDVRRSTVGYAEEYVRQWFDECGDDLDERAFRIALAVFNEASYLDVEAAARDLAQRLKPRPDEQKQTDQEPAKKTSPFGVSRSTRLKRARAATRSSEIVTEYSDHARLEIVYLQDRDYPAALIRLLWTEFGDFRDIFIAWLHDHAGIGKADIRNRAATAVGLLATIDFENICDKVLYPWARPIEDDRDLTRKYRAALTTAMFSLVLDNQANTEALGLLRYWTEQVNRPHLMWAAIRCYSAVGLRYPREALESWRKVIDQVDEMLIVDYEDLSFFGSPMLISMLDAIESLFMSAFEWQDRFYSLYEQILEGLQNWVRADEQPKSTSRLGIPLFLMLMSIPIPTESENPDIDTRPPALLVMFDGKDASAPGLDPLVWLLRKVLNNQKTRQAALALLRAWFAFVDEDTRYKPPLNLVLEKFLAAPHLSQRESGRLQLMMQRWAEHPDAKKRSAVAGELLNELMFK